MIRKVTAWFLGMAITAGILVAGGSSFADKPLRIHIISGSKEYGSEPSLKAWKKGIESECRVEITASWASDGAKELEGIDSLAEADVMLVFARRMKLDDVTMGKVRAHWEAGKPVVGLRTASHAFSNEVNEVFDSEVLGNHYDGHYGNEAVKVEAVKEVADHPVLAGVGAFTSRRLYKAGALPEGTTVLQTGDNGKGVEPVTMVSEHAGGRVLYSSLGLQEDFENGQFLRLLKNAVFWVAGKEAKDYEKK